MTGDAALTALKAAAEAIDPAVNTLAAASALDGGDGTVGNSVGETEETSTDALSIPPSPSIEVQSILVDLGRAALKANAPSCWKYNL